jgi:site-specific DNA recombinase
VNGLLEALLKGEGGNGSDAPEAPIKALAWARVSTDMQEERGLSIPEQFRDFETFAARTGAEIKDRYSEAVSAFQHKARRREFERMLTRAKEDPEINAILVHDYSRFSRDSLEAKILVRDLRKRGVRVISLNDPEIDPDSVAGVYMEAFTFAKNEAYSREVAFHTRKGCRANVRTRDRETGWCYKNGGDPLWGYRIEHLVRGEERKGRPIIKSIWVPNEEVVAGRPLHEWTRHCLLELAAKGGSLQDLADFCNRQGIPAPRQPYWGHTTWNSLVHPHSLLQYTGYGVWNARGQNQRWNPPSEWVIVETAHEALITEEQAVAIVEVRQNDGRKQFDTGFRQSRDSGYLLSGGPFTCERCGSNMIGFKKGNGTRYYVCGSQPYRRGMGCGPGVYVPQTLVEGEVLTGLEGLVGVCTDPDGFTRQVNEELRRIWEESVGYDPTAKRRLAEVEAKIGNLWRAIEDGITQTGEANKRLAALTAEKERLETAAPVVGEAPQIDVDTAMAYRRDVPKLLKQGSPAERKRLLRAWVQEIKLAPDRLEVEITYRVPEPVMNIQGAGAVFHP